jgi:hypothetical protein
MVYTMQIGLAQSNVAAPVLHEPVMIKTLTQSTRGISQAERDMVEKAFAQQIGMAIIEIMNGLGYEN